MYDVLIRNGTIVDGTGAPAFTGDVAMLGNTIAAVGHDLPQDAREIIDAAGLIVSPGFIDWHSHSDLTALMGFAAPNILEQGITLEIAGHCGVSVVPLCQGKVSNVGYMARPEQVEAIGAAGGGFAAYIEALKKLPLATNIAAFVGHGNVRASVMGFANRAPTAEELASMKTKLDEAMEAGALGMSSGLIYPPGSYSTPEELTELAAHIARYKGAQYTTHMRSEGDRVVESVQETLALGRAAGLPVIISHHKIAGQHNRGLSEKTLALISAAKAAGQTVYLDAYPYDGGATSLMSAIPPCFMADGAQTLLKNLKNPGLRRQITQVLESPGDDFENLTYQSGFDRILVASESKPEINGKSLLRLAEERGQSPYDTLYDLLIETGGDAGAAYRMISQWDMENILRYPFTMAGIDGEQAPSRGRFAHPRSGATFPRILGTFCRDKGFYSLEACIHRFTGMAARAAGFPKKGLIQAGMDADLVIFSFERIAGNADYDSADRPNEGIEMVFVNGVKAVEGGVITGLRGGKALLRGGREA